jgi:Amidohydrolase
MTLLYEDEEVRPSEETIMMKVVNLTTIRMSPFLVIFLLFHASCSKQPQRYTMGDFSKVRKIDAHVHDNSESTAFVDVAAENGFRLLSINVDYPDFPPLDAQRRCNELRLGDHPDILAYASTFEMAGWDNPDWVKNTIAHLDSSFAQGAIAVKFWKNIGMVVRDKNGRLIMINDGKFDAIISHLTQRNIPVIFHCGEPRDCWLPVEKMMSNDMKEYFSHHPQYHMYVHPEMPSYEDQISARNGMLDKNPNLKFIGAHLGSLEWSVDELSKFLDKYPNATVDLAARMDYIQIQSQKDLEKIYKFFCAYQDRILYGSDLIINPTDDPKLLKEEVHEKWLSDWKYLATDSTMTLGNIVGPFKGLGLPSEVIDKIYCRNAEKIFGAAWKKRNETSAY